MNRPLPKQPRKVSKAKKTLPVEIDWGGGMKDRLRYISPREEELIRRNRSTNAVRHYGGVRAYPDPGDTAAGESLGVTSGTTTGTTVSNGSATSGSTEGSRQGGGDTGASSAGGMSSGATASTTGGVAGLSGTTGVGSAASTAPSSSVSSSATTGGIASLGGTAESAIHNTEEAYRSGTSVSSGNITSGRISGLNAPARTEPSYRMTQSEEAAAESFYANDSLYQDALAEDRYKAAYDNATLSDALSNAYSALQNSPLNVAKTASAIGNFAQSAYNDPYGAAIGALQGALNTVGGIYEGTVGRVAPYMTGEKQLFNAYGNVNPQTAEDFSSVAGNLAGLGTGAGFAAGIPENSVGALIGTRARGYGDVFSEASRLKNMGATPEEIYNETAQMTGPLGGGVTTFMGKPVIEINSPFELKGPYARGGFSESLLGSEITKPTPMSEIVERNAAMAAYPGMGDIPIQPRVMSEYYEGNYGAYNPPKLSPALAERLVDPTLTTPTIENNMPITMSGIERLSSYLQNRKIAAPQDTFEKTLAHEAGHYVADFREYPQGTSPESVIGEIKKYNPTRQITEDQAAMTYYFDPGEWAARRWEDDLTNVNLKDYRNSFSQRFNNTDRVRQVISDPDYRYRYYRGNLFD